MTLSDISGRIFLQTNNWIDHIAGGNHYFSTFYRIGKLTKSLPCCAENKESTPWLEETCQTIGNPEVSTLIRLSLLVIQRPAPVLVVLPMSPFSQGVDPARKLPELFWTNMQRFHPQKSTRHCQNQLGHSNLPVENM